MKKKISMLKDFGLNIAGSLLITGVLQLLIYPLLAKTNNPETFGLILTFMGIVSITALVFGNSLNNVRLIMNNQYERERLNGDFNLLYIFSVIFVIIIYFLIFQKVNFGVLNETIILLTIILTMTKSYFSVTFRLNLNYRKILLFNFVTCIGYLVGIFLTIKFNIAIWVFTFICGEIIAIIFLILNSSLFYEPVKRTKLFIETSKKYLVLMFSTLIANILIYFDRLLLFPILGGDAVSVYTVAAFFGKSAALIITPISGVLLSYYSQNSFKMNKSLFWKINVYTIIFSLILFTVSIIISPQITGFLYPTLIDKATPLLTIANLAAIIGIIGNVTKPAILRFAKIKWQVIEQIIYAFVYIILAIILLINYGIFGFCIGVILANTTRLILLYIIGHNSLKTN